MRITSKGQVTIPQDIRERFGLVPETEVDFVVRGNAIQLVKSKSSKRISRGESIVRRLKGTATVRLSTDEIMSLTRK
jgi:AbrB family looped-hinge helix DNA binding protein